MTGAAPSGLSSEGSHAPLNALLIGRFNSWKGQAILLHAIGQLPAELRANVRVRLVGSVFGDQQHFCDQLVKLIADCGLSELVEMFPFACDPYQHYSWADVVVVTSTKPEPFGLVAIEAMAAGRAVIAANHGGLSEIVLDGVTGSLVVPGSVESLASTMASYIRNPRRAAVEGSAGRERFAAEFEEKIYKLKITNLLAELCGPKFA